MLNSESKAEHLPRGTFLYEWGRGRYWIHVFADGEGGEYSEAVDEEAALSRNDLTQSDCLQTPSFPMH